MRLCALAVLVVTFAAPAVGASADPTAPAPTAAPAAGPREAAIGRGLELGLALGASRVVGGLGGDAIGYSVRPYAGYELANGLAVLAGASYSRWDTGHGTMWELSARAGVRWTFTWRRFLPWVEGAIGYGQIIPPDQFGGGLRASGGLGVDYLADERVRAGVHLGVERIQVGYPISPTTWLDVGLGVTFFPM